MLLHYIITQNNLRTKIRKLRHHITRDWAVQVNHATSTKNNHSTDITEFLCTTLENTNQQENIKYRNQHIKKNRTFYQTQQYV